MSGRIMAVDYGEKNLGIAVSDVSATLAQPVGVIERSELRADLERLAKLARDYDVKRIVVGYPRTLAGTAGPQARAVDVFIKRLEKAFNLPVDRYDERLSTREAKSWLAEMGIRGEKAKAAVDKVAAALVLQSYLDKKGKEASV